MTIAAEVIRLRPGSAEVSDLRAAAGNGDPNALRKYVLFAAWQKIRGDGYIPRNRRVRVFRSFVDTTDIEVTLLRV